MRGWTFKKLSLQNQVHLLGYRNDIDEICKASDIFAFPSKREGLGLAALEAMASGLPIITSNVHGIVDYSINGITGYRCNPNDQKGFEIFINKLNEQPKDRIKIGRTNQELVKQFDINKVMTLMKKIYLNNIIS